MIERRDCKHTNAIKPYSEAERKPTPADKNYSKARQVHQNKWDNAPPVNTISAGTNLSNIYC